MGPVGYLVIGGIVIFVLVVINVLLSFRRVKSGVDSDEVESNGNVVLDDNKRDVFKQVVLSNGTLALFAKDETKSADIAVVCFKNGKRSVRRYVVSFPNGDNASIVLPSGCNEVKVVVYAVNGVKTHASKVYSNPLAFNIIFSVLIAGVAALFGYFVIVYYWQNFIHNTNPGQFYPLFYLAGVVLAVPVGIVTPIVIDLVARRGGK